MRRGWLAWVLCVATAVAADYAVTATDDLGRRLPGAEVEAVFGRLNDPRESATRVVRGRTDAGGAHRFSVGDDLCLVRLRVTKEEHHEADLDHRHGLDVFPSRTQHTIVLPTRSPGVPLCYREVRLSRKAGHAFGEAWVGFDLELGEIVGPGGRGQVADIQIRNQGARYGWSRDEARLDILRKEAARDRVGEEEFAELYGSFRGKLTLRFPGQGDGLTRSADYWPYCELKMPPAAPAAGYLGETAFPYDSAVIAEPGQEDVGFYLRVRTKFGPGGEVRSANYAKIMGPIGGGYGQVTFRYYYNPVPNDRRLVMDLGRNLLKPPPGADRDEQARYRPSWP